MNNSMNFTLFNRIKPQPKQEETPSPQPNPDCVSWDQALEVSKEIEETVLLAEAPPAPVSDGPTAAFPHVAVGAPEPRRMTVTTGETHETQTDIETAVLAAVTTAHEQLEQRSTVYGPTQSEVRDWIKEEQQSADRYEARVTQAELVSKIAAANEEITAATEPEVTPPKEDTSKEDSVGWFTVIVSLFFGLSVFMFKHAAALVITFLTYVDPETEEKWVTKKVKTTVEA